PLYNGNISQTIWSSKSTDQTKRAYGYKYDALNRLSVAYSRKGHDLNTADKYSMWLDYDKNGNINRLFRNGVYNTVYGRVDDLSYGYIGNQLTKVTENGSSLIKSEGFKDINNAIDYTYDVNGNMTKDLNKGITNISYNHLNLPTKIHFRKGRSIDYKYDARGVKLEKEARGEYGDPSSTQYAGNYIYKKNPGRGAQLKLAFFNHPEGYVSPKNASDISQGFKYVYQYKDHLGNVRLSYTDQDKDGVITPSTEIIEESNYYPFGLKHKGYNNVVNGREHTYKYHGKEHEEELGYNMYDFDMRHYDPAIARWVVVDPLAEDMRRHSPYNFAFNNPIFFIDPDGMSPIAALDDPIFDKRGNKIGDDGKTDGKIHVVHNNRQARGIKRQTENGNNAIDLTGKDVVTLNGGKATVEGVVASVEAQGEDTGRDTNSSDAGLHEEGGHTEVDADGNVTTVAWESGPKKSVTGNGSIKLFNGTSPRDYPSSSELADYWHVHTSKTQEVDKSDGTTETYRGSMTPSGGDTNAARSMENNGYKATAIQVGTSNGVKVNFYNSGGVIFKMSLRNFKKLKND
ncbi:RHS repeat domain-containing protein, partial [Tenacibaculum maritimum]|uniref:RHS repeat domain-containing protein n=1 Tax=Tenacibaculum maritimum TaxID=107401 RepID=UPI0023EE3461